MKKLLFLISFLLLSFSLKMNAKNNLNIDKVKLLIWWDYLAEDVIKKLKINNFVPVVTVYKTNEMAISRILGKENRFDVVVLSNLSIDSLVKTKLLEKSFFTDIAKKRSYLTMFDQIKYHCLPYLWSSTVFVSDTRFVSSVPEKLKDLLLLKKQGYQVGIIDDVFEITSRILGDKDRVCKQEVTSKLVSNFSILKNCPYALNEEAFNYQPKDFTSSINELLKQPKIATYGWHGEALNSLNKYKWLKAKIAKKHPVVGYDAVCVLKERTGNVSIKRLKKFIELLTDKQSSALNVQYSQYFSPYKNHTTNLSPPAKKLYKEIEAFQTRAKPIVITSPNPKVHKIINQWWRTVRYEK